MLISAERNKLEGFASILNNEELENKDADDDNDKEIVEEEIREDIEFCLLQFSGVEEVENLEEDKYVEEESQVLTIFFIPNFKLII